MTANFLELQRFTQRRVRIIYIVVMLILAAAFGFSFGEQ
jgi:hypothetical protein